MYDNIFQEPRHLQNFKKHPVFAVWSEVDKSSESKKSEPSNSSSSTSSNPASFFSQPSQILKSRINERDVYGYSLLHYAAMLGDEPLCERLLSVGANPNLIYYDDTLPLSECKKTPLYLALARGHSKIAACLLPITNNTGISNSHLGDSQSEESVVWYKNAINDALMISYPNCKQNDWTFAAPSTFFKEPAMPITSESNEEEFKKFTNLVYRICELGEINLLRNLLVPLLTDKEAFKNLFSSQKLADFPEDKNLLHAAVCSGSIETVEFLLSQGICDLNAPRKQSEQLEAYPTTALMMAVMQKNNEMLKVLLSKGANVNDKDKKQWTSLMMAMKTGDLLSIQLLWQVSTTETHALKNMDGQTFLHIAAQYTDNELIWNYLRKKLGDNFESLMRIPDKYGFSALDWAIFQKNIAALNCFDETQKNQFMRDPRYGVFPSSTQQLKIEKKIQYRLKLKGRSLTYLANDKNNEEALHGLCNGMVFLKTYYNKKFGPKYFPHVKKLMAEWDGSLKNLEKPFEKTDPFYYVFKEVGYKNLDDLMEQWTNDLIYFWGGSARFDSDIRSFDRTALYESIAPTKNQGAIDRVSTLYNDQDRMPAMGLSENLTRWLRKTSEELAEIIHYFSKLSIEHVIEISSDNHVVEITSKASKILDCDDPNQFFELAGSITPREAASHIYDYLYVRRRNAKEKKLYNTIKDYTYESNDNVEQLSETDLFGESKTPHTATEIEIFQESSPSHFTPLHVVAILHQNKWIETFLKNPAIDVNAVDSREFTPLTLALIVNNEQGASLLFQHPALSLSHLLTNTYYAIRLDRFSGFQAGLKSLSQRQIEPQQTKLAIRELVLCLNFIQNVFASEPQKRLAYVKTFIENLPEHVVKDVIQTIFIEPPFNEYCLINVLRGTSGLSATRSEELKLLLKSGADLFLIEPKNPYARRAPIEVSCLVPDCDGVLYVNLPSKEKLWDSYYTSAPKQQRQCVERYNIVKRA